MRPISDARVRVTVPSRTSPASAVASASRAVYDATQPVSSQLTSSDVGDASLP